MKVTIVGGGSTYTAGIVRAIIEQKEHFPVEEIFLYDTDSSRNQRMFLITKEIIKDKGINLKESTDIEKALKDSAYIFTQIRVGGQKMRSLDEKIPIKHGLVGQETCGLGGYAYALRTIGPMLNIIENVLKFAPDAWVLNYTNPESILAYAIHQKYPEAKVINACDMTIAMENVIGRTFNYDIRNWEKIYYGLNHFGWYTSITDKESGKELLPEIVQKIQKQGLDVRTIGETDDSWIQQYNRIQSMVELFPNSIPNLYMQYYFLPRDILNKSDINYTRADMVLNGREKKTERIYQQILENHDIELENHFNVHGEYIVKIARSIENNENNDFTLIIPNKNIISNLSSDAMIEVPTYVGKKGAIPQFKNLKIDAFHQNLLERQILSEKMLVHAHLNNDYDMLYQAFCLNQTVDDVQIAEEVLNELMHVNKAYWANFKN